MTSKSAILSFPPPRTNYTGGTLSACSKERVKRFDLSGSIALVFQFVQSCLTDIVVAPRSRSILELLLS